VRTKEKFSVLLVDDDPTVIRILSRILCEFAPLRFATSGRVALKLARESVPDLVMLDVEMPEFSGFEICKAFKSDPALAAVPIIFISSHESPELETIGLQLGAADFIGKPPHASLVLARVRTYQQLKMLSDTVRTAVTMDFLTGASTRRQLEKTLTQEWLRAQRSRKPLSLLLADIDHFAAFNEKYGEDAGDACLHAVAEALRGVAQRPADVLARYAGGQFALLFPETDRDGALALAQRALQAVDDLPVMPAASGDAVQHPSLSVGVVCLDSFEGSGTPATCGVPIDLLAAVERAGKTAKSAGGHRAEFAALDEPDEPGQLGEHAPSRRFAT